MKKTFKILVVSSLLFLTMIFCSCDGYLKLQYNKDGSVSFGFTGDMGKAFEEMLSSIGEDLTIDSEAIALELEEEGFSNVKVSHNNEVVEISFTDIGKESYIFDTKLVSIDGDEIKVSITPDKFLKLYNTSGEDLQMLLDLFLSPVLNEEVLSEEEYIDTINVTYGEDVGKEINESIIHFSVIDKKGKKKNKNIFIKSILCGSEILF